MARGRKGKGNKAETVETKAGQEEVEAVTDTTLGGSEQPEELVGEVPKEGATVNGNSEPVGSTKDAEGETKGEKKKGGRFRRGRKKGGKTTGKPEREVEVAGLIFMCNGETKKDCYKYRVFGLPEAKKSIVEKVTKNMKLFLFDLDQKSLYGIYKASSAGGMNLEAEAFKNSERKFPAQVRFRIHKECLPLESSIFKPAIKENYYGRNKFKCELSAEQVTKLMQLFRPLDERGLPKPKPEKEVRKEPFKSRNPRGPPPPRRPPPRGPSSWAGAPRFPREPAYARDYPPAYARDPISSELELRRLDQLRTAPQDLYQPSLTASHLVSNPDIDLLEAETLYRQRLQLRQMQEARADVLDRRAYHIDPLLDTSLRQAGISGDLSRKRSLEEILLDERALAPKRPLLQDDLLRGTEYQREVPVGSYLDGLHTASASLPYGSISSQGPWLY